MTDSLEFNCIFYYALIEYVVVEQEVFFACFVFTGKEVNASLDQDK